MTYVPPSTSVVNIVKDYYREPMGQVLEDAQQFAKEMDRPDIAPQNPAYWVAWFAARRTAGALLEAAKHLNLSEAQYMELNRVAAWVAPD